MNCTPGSVDGTLPMCRERLVAVTGRSSPASCWPGTVTVEEPVTDSGCDDNTPCHNNSLVTQLQQLVTAHLQMLCFGCLELTTEKCHNSDSVTAFQSRAKVCVCGHNQLRTPGFH